MNKQDFEIIERAVLLRILAPYYWALGLNVTHINSNREGQLYSRFKGPTHEWEPLKDNRIEYPKVKLYDWDNATGIGAVTGTANLRCLDIDGCQDILFINSILSNLGLPQHYEWVVKTGSFNGYHIWIRVEDPPYAIEGDNIIFSSNLAYANKFKKIELRWRSHVVLPPTIHYSGFPYIFCNTQIPKTFPSTVSKGKLEECLNRIGKLNEPIETGAALLLQEEQTIALPKYSSESENEPKILFFDLETSGLPPKAAGSSDAHLSAWPYIVQLAFIQTDYFEHTLYANDFILKPEGYSIPEESVKIHRISHNYALHHGISRQKALEHFIKIISLSDVLVAHNIEFDLSILRIELRRMGLEDPTAGKRLICTMKIGANYCKTPDNKAYKWPTLSELYGRTFGTQLKEAHNAKVDIEATAACFWEMYRVKVFTLTSDNQRQEDQYDYKLATKPQAKHVTNSVKPPDPDDLPF